MEDKLLLAGKLIEIIETSRNNALRKVNEELIQMYWLVGNDKRIKERCCDLPLMEEVLKHYDNH